jgi:predicted small metal-binding protein
MCNYTVTYISVSRDFYFLSPRNFQGSQIVVNSASSGGSVMPKEMRCGDVVPGCDFVARGDSEQEILQQAAEHARNEHGLDEITPDLAEKVRGAIRDEAA